MPSITITDLQNAKKDVDHIGAIATSPAGTATDRLGTVKNTIAGSLALIAADVAAVDASRIAGQGLIDADVAAVDARRVQAVNVDIPAHLVDLAAFNERGAWATGTAYAIKDIYISSSIAYVVTLAHTSSTVTADLAAGKVAVHQGATREELAASSGAGLVGFIQPGAGAVTRTLKDKSLESISVKDFGAKGDGVTDDTLALMHAFAAFTTGMLVIPPGKYIISYDTVNPYTNSRAPLLNLGSSVIKCPCFFGVENAAILAYGAEFFVKNNAKTAETYDATFGIIMSIGKFKNVKVRGLKLNGNGFNQPLPGSSSGNLSFAPRNHGISFFRNDNTAGSTEVVSDISIRDCEFVALGWHDTRKMDVGDNAGDGLLFFGIKSLKNLDVSYNRFIDVGRWAVALDIFEDQADTYENINVIGNYMLNDRNTTTGYANGARNLGFVDIEATVNLKRVNITDNVLEGGRIGTAIGGGGTNSATVLQLNDIKFNNNTMTVRGDMHWYLLGFGTSVNGPTRNFNNFEFKNNTLTMDNLRFPLWIYSGKCIFTNYTLMGNTLLNRGALASDVGGLLLAAPGMYVQGVDNIASHNTITGFGHGIKCDTVATADHSGTIRVFENTISKCANVFLLDMKEANVGAAVHFTGNYITPDCGWGSANAPFNATLTGPQITIENIEPKRLLETTVPYKVNGNVVLKSQRVQANFESSTSPYFGYYLKGQKAIAFQDPWAQGNYEGLICKVEGHSLSSNVRGDAAWVTAQSISTISGFYGPTLRFNATKMYQAMTTGTTGATAPTHTIGDVSDGGVTWRYIGPVAVFTKFGAVL